MVQYGKENLKPYQIKINVEVKTETGVEDILLDIYAICYEDNIDFILVAVPVSIVYVNKKNMVNITYSRLT
jgi:hypothetical protein